MNHLDTIIQALTPTVMVPKHERPQYLSDNGHRFLMASDGIWMEGKAPWGHFVLPLRIIPEVSFPYGNIEPYMEFKTPNGKLPLDLVRQFVDLARETPDTEVAAWVIFDSNLKTMRLHMMESHSSSGSHIHYKCPELTDDESVLMDIHSHAHHPAYFSPQDDSDDAGAFRIAVVVGNLDKPEISLAARLCMYGKFEELPIPVPNGLEVWGAV